MILSDVGLKFKTGGKTDKNEACDILFDACKKSQADDKYLTKLYTHAAKVRQMVNNTEPPLKKNKTNHNNLAADMLLILEKLDTSSR